MKFCCVMVILALGWVLLINLLALVGVSVLVTLCGSLPFCRIRDLAVGGLRPF